jgi:hypothetical protein
MLVYTRAHIRYITRAVAPVGSTGANSAAKTSAQTPLTTARMTPISAPLALPKTECQPCESAPRGGNFQRGNIHEIPSPA